MEDVRIIVAGGRDFQDYVLMEKKLDEILEDLSCQNPIIVSGTAQGADTLGERYAKEHHLSVKKFPADWETYGKAAGPVRNMQMAQYASEGVKGVLVAFWDEKSRGTKNMIETVAKKDLIVYVVNY